jgi:tripartite-type tricarboxylate transporter receptor subunit TctC
MAESGLPGFDVTSWFCIVGPAGIPAPIVTRLNREIVTALNHPEARQRLIAAGVNIESTTPQELTAFVRAEIEKMGKAVRNSGAKVD